METKQTLPELQIGSQDCPAITPAWLGARLSPDFGSLVFSLPKNQKKDFKHYSWSISAVEITSKPWEGCAQMEHLLLECAQGPSKQCWDTTHVCGVSVSPGWTANTSLPWSKGLYPEAKACPFFPPCFSPRGGEFSGLMLPFPACWGRSWWESESSSSTSSTDTWAAARTPPAYGHLSAESHKK